MLKLSIILLVVVVLLALFCAGRRRHSPVDAGKSYQPGLDIEKLASDTIRVGTYNIHSGKGTDGVRDLNRIRAVISDSDLIGLQEVRAGMDTNQASKLAGGSGWIFVPTLRRWWYDYYGNALVSTLPVLRWQTWRLPNLHGRRFRSYTLAEVKWGASTMSVLFTHLHTREGRLQQLERVLEHFGHLPVPALLVGDLNSRSDDPVLRRHLPPDATDALSHVRDVDEERVDWILARGLDVTGGGVSGPGPSDHPYYWVDVTLSIR